MRILFGYKPVEPRAHETTFQFAYTQSTRTFAFYHNHCKKEHLQFLLLRKEIFLAWKKQDNFIKYCFIHFAFADSNVPQLTK